jgi:hypothetical protein
MENEYFYYEFVKLLGKTTTHAYRRESEESGGTDTMSDTPDVDLFQLQMNTLRFVPYRSFFHRYSHVRLWLYSLLPLSSALKPGFRIRIRINLSCWIRIRNIG